MVNVPGEAKPVSYQDASLIAMKDADLSKAAWEARTLLEPQAGKSQINEPAAMIALGQFIHGSLFTPSQLATAWQQARNQESKTLWAQRWRRSAPDLRLALPEKVQPFTRVPPSMVGKSAAIISRKEQTEPTPGMQRLLEEKEVKPLSTANPAYFKDRQVQ